MFKFLELEESKVSIGRLILLIAIAYLFSVSVRYIWVNEFSSVENFRWNNELMINTNDGYYWAEGARDILRDKSHYKESPTATAISQLTALFAKVLPFSFETIILYMPSFLGSLLVIPIILMGHLVRLSYVGFVGALVGSIAWSYYNRTMVGYYDTDMLTIVLPTFTLWSILFAVTEQKNRWLLITIGSIFISMYWYNGAYSLNISFAIMVLLYTLIFDRKAIFNYKLISFILLGILAVGGYIQLLLAIFIFTLFHKFEHRDEKFKKLYDFLDKKNIDETKLVFIVLGFI
jgi:dolichyl-diphosphooligosaccharide--protein glycosyltransferase/undecaprenyl-diphosphooligosaccharide--protein glycosyltransferase